MTYKPTIEEFKIKKGVGIITRVEVINVKAYE